MGVSIYMKVSKDGQLMTEGAGSVESIGAFSKTSHADEIMVLTCNHEIVTPINEVSGAITGARQHKPFQITKLLDKATPILHASAANNDKLEVEVECWRPNEQNQGQPEHFFTFVLTNAKVIGIKFLAPDYTDKSVENDMPREVVSFSYETINWENVACSTTAQDNFNES